MAEERKSLTLSIQARCETLARGYLRAARARAEELRVELVTAEDDEQAVQELKATMLRALAFAFQEFPELEARINAVEATALEDLDDLDNHMRERFDEQQEKLEHLQDRINLVERRTL